MQRFNHRLLRTSTTKLSFHTLAVTAATVAGSLALLWIFAPTLLLSQWSISYSGPVGLMGRRSAALFAGLAVMFFRARNAGNSPTRSALAAGFIVACLTLAMLGIAELATAHAEPGILCSSLIEVGLASAFAYLEYSSRRSGLQG